MSVTGEHALQSEDLPREPLNIPEWGGDVYVRVLAGDERAKIQRAIDKNSETLSALIVQLCTVDDVGAQMFKADDISRLHKKSGLVLDRIVTKCHKINKLDEKEIEDLAKNSDETPSDSSGSD